MSVRVHPLQRGAWTRALAPSTIGTVGIGLGLLALFLALPPAKVRTAPLPVAIGIFAVAAGIWAYTRGERRIGGGAVVSGLAGIGIALIVMQANGARLEGVFVWSALIAATLRYATPLTFAAIGGMFSERSGVVNIGLEGMMLMGAYFGAYGADATGSWVGGLFIGLISGALLAFVHAIFTITLRADQIVTGTAINFLALGVTGYLYNQHYGNNGTPENLPAVPDVNLKFLSHIPPQGLGNFLYNSIGQLNLMVWLSLLLLPVSYVALFKTPIGLRIGLLRRPVQDADRTADPLGR